MNAQALLDLAARCEAATGPCYALSREIGDACGMDERYEHPGSQNASHRNYTASLDAAMTLVPEGHQFLVEHYPWSDHPSGNKSCAQVGNAHPIKTARIAAATPALALTAAALRARAASVPTPHTDPSP